MGKQKSIALVLAAGYSRRFGLDKRQYQLANGKTLLQQSVDLALSCHDGVVVVLRHDDSSVARSLDDFPVQVINAPKEPKGMGVSISAATSQILNAQTLSIIPADMPLIDSSTMSLLLTNSTAENITFPVNATKRGHPVIFGNMFFDDLVRLRGDHGGRNIITENPEYCYPVEVDDLGIFFDIDQRTDLDLAQF